MIQHDKTIVLKPSSVSDAYWSERPGQRIQELVSDASGITLVEWDVGSRVAVVCGSGTALSAFASATGDELRILGDAEGPVLSVNLR